MNFQTEENLNLDVLILVFAKAKSISIIRFLDNISMFIDVLFQIIYHLLWDLSALIQTSLQRGQNDDTDNERLIHEIEITCVDWKWKE